MEASLYILNTDELQALRSEASHGTSILLQEQASRPRIVYICRHEGECTPNWVAVKTVKRSMHAMLSNGNGQDCVYGYVHAYVFASF